MDNLNNDNSSVAVADNSVQEPASANTGTVNAGGQETEVSPSDNDLFKGIDPTKLPPEAKAAYDSMLRDYRDKTGKLSERVKSEASKAAEAFKQKAEQYDQISSQEEFVKQWNDYVKKYSEHNNGEKPSEGDPRYKELESKLEEVRSEVEMSKLKDITDAFADAVNEKGEKVNPDFDSLNEIIVGELDHGEGKKEPFSLLRACIELAGGNNPQEKLALGYKMAKQVKESIFEEGRKAGLGKVQSKILNSSTPPTNISGDLNVTDTKPKNAREALEMARRRQVYGGK